MRALRLDPDAPRLPWLIAQGLKLDVSCTARGCGRHAEFDPAPLLARLGNVYVVLAGVRLSCSRCGPRGPDTRPAWPKPPTRWRG